MNMNTNYSVKSQPAFGCRNCDRALKLLEKRGVKHEPAFDYIYSIHCQLNKEEMPMSHEPSAKRVLKRLIKTLRNW